MYFYQSKEALRLTLAAMLTKFDRVMQLAAIARKYDLDLASNADYEKAMFELIMEVSRHQKLKLSFLQRSVCTIRNHSRLSGHVRTISENDLEYLADQIRNEPIFAKIYIHTPEEIQKHALDLLPDYLKEMIISGRKRAEIPDAKSQNILKREGGIDQHSQFDQVSHKAENPSDLPKEGSALYKKGDMIGEDYEVRGIIGKGGFGVVFLVYSRSMRDVRALKTFRDELLSNPDAREAFKREALLWVNLETYPYILAAKWMSEVSGRLFVEMDYIAPDDQGRVNLADHLARAGGPLDTNQALRWAIQFCLGMEHARAHGIECHRDIKPANILITPDGMLKISDFGLSAAAEVAWRGSGGLDASLLSMGEDHAFGFSLMQSDGKVRCGTPGYMAPEVYRYEGADIRSDIYSFGLVLWQMASGSRSHPFSMPWQGDMERYLRGIYEQQIAGRVPRIKEPLGSIIERCLLPSPSERFGNFQELRGSLEPIWQERTGRKFEIPQIREQTADSWNNKGGALNALGRHEEAIECCERALAINPRYGAGFVTKGAALAFLGRYEEAISCYDNALRIDPQDTDSWNNKGHALWLLGRHEDAIACWDRALVLDPQSTRTWNYKGFVLLSLGRHEEAIGCCDHALAIDLQNICAWNNKGNALSSLGRYEEAIDCYDKVLAIDPRDADAWYNKALEADKLGRFREAMSFYRKVIELASPTHASETAYARQRLQELESK